MCQEDDDRKLRLVHLCSDHDIKCAVHELQTKRPRFGTNHAPSDEGRVGATYSELRRLGCERVMLWGGLLRDVEPTRMRTESSDRWNHAAEIWRGWAIRRSERGR